MCMNSGGWMIRESSELTFTVEAWYQENVSCVQPELQITKNYISLPRMRKGPDWRSYRRGSSMASQSAQHLREACEMTPVLTYALKPAEKTSNSRLCYKCHKDGCIACDCAGLEPESTCRSTIHTIWTQSKQATVQDSSRNRIMQIQMADVIASHTAGGLKCRKSLYILLLMGQLAIRSNKRQFSICLM